MSFYDLSIYLSVYILATGLIGWILSVVEKKRKAVAVDSGRGPQHLPRMFQTPATWGKVFLLALIATFVIIALMIYFDRMSGEVGFNIVMSLGLLAAVVTVAYVILSNQNHWVAGLKTSVLVLCGTIPAFYYYCLDWEDMNMFFEEMLPMLLIAAAIAFPVAMLLWLIRNQNIASAILLGVVSIFLEAIVFQGWFGVRIDFLAFIGFLDPAVGITRLVYAYTLITLTVLSLLPKARERILAFLIASVPMIIGVAEALNYYLRYNSDTYVSYDHGTYIDGEWVEMNVWKMNGGLSTILIISISVLFVAGAALIVLSLRTEKKLRKEQLQP